MRVVVVGEEAVRGISATSAGQASSAGRASSKREAIVAVLDQNDDFRSAQDIHDELRRNGPKVGLATVYRTLQAMQAAGEVDSLRSDNGEVGYRSCSQTHHHHLVCRICGKTVEVAGPAVERWAERTASEHGFSEVSHTVEMVGVCGDH